MVTPQQATAVQRTVRRRCTNPQPLHAALVADALLTLKTASAVAGLSEATLYRRAANDKTFPRLIRMGARCTRIRAGDLLAWLSAQAGAST